MSGPDLIADAAAWLRDDPSFRLATRAEQETAATGALSELGGDAGDPLAVAMVIEAALGPVAAPPAGFVRVEVADDAPAPARVSARLNAALNRVDTGGALLYRVKAATGWPDRELAEALGISRATVQAYIGGRLAENLSADNLKRLRDNLAQRQAALAAVLSDVEGRL